jgi:hypothetical protein
MPDDTGFPTPDELINGTGPTERAPASASPSAPTPPFRIPGSADIYQVSSDQEKAIRLVLSGLPYVVIACRETVEGRPAKPGEEPTGCDFHTALGGDHEVLRNVKGHLPDAIDRIYHRHGIL